MLAFAYILPIVACLLLCFAFDYCGDFTAYLWVFIGGEATVGLLHFIFYRASVTATEYLGSYIEALYYEAAWTQLVPVTETRTDRRGRSYTVTRYKRRYHPPRYYFRTSRLSKVDTTESFFRHVAGVWQTEAHPDVWHGVDIVGGARHGRHYLFADLKREQQEHPDYWISVTEPNFYKNKIRNSNSIFRFEKIGREEAEIFHLCRYPEVKLHDMPAILSTTFTIDPADDLLMRKFNAYWAPRSQMRLFVILFPAAMGVGVALKQQALWQGGNKNEFVVCLGYDPDERQVKWAKTFSWADEQTLEVEADQWWRDHPQLDFQAFYSWLTKNVSRWNRKQFKDFDYIRVELKLWQLITILCLSAAENALALYLTVAR